MSAPETPSLFETMRAVGGEIPRLDRHLDRLRASSRVFGIPFDPDAARLELARAIGEGRQRVRMVLSPNGALTVETVPLLADVFRTAWICRVPMPEAGGVFCQHKTTHREHYEWRWRAGRAHGADETIVLNTAGEVMEGTRTNVWVDMKGKLLTPPLSSGGLPGVERAHLLAMRPDAHEHVLFPGDLEQADAVFVSNALRGLMRVELVGGDD